MVNYIIKIFRYIIKILLGVINSLEKLQRNSQDKPWYYLDDIVKRDALLRDIYQKIDSGQTWLEAIRNPEALNHGERVAEYAFIASYLKKNKPLSILDVGCVLNNTVIADYIEQQSRIYFLNPAFETVHYKEYGYFKFPLSDWHLPLTFSLVTCLSTIEHIGFDNSRYGVNEVDQGWDWPRCIEEVVRSIEILYSTTEPGGTIIASCPYGREEFVLMPPETGVRTAQVLHVGHVEALRKNFGRRINITTLRLSEHGWNTCNPEARFQQYGTIGPGASGLILIDAKKNKNDISKF